MQALDSRTRLQRGRLLTTLPPLSNFATCDKIFNLPEARLHLQNGSTNPALSFN